MNVLLIGSIKALEANWWPRWNRKKQATPCSRCNRRDVNVQVHPVDSLHLQGDVLGQHFGNTSWYAHFRLRYDSDPSGSTAASAA